MSGAVRSITEVHVTYTLTSKILKAFCKGIPELLRIACADVPRTDVQILF